jgi:hypothetical protein
MASLITMACDVCDTQGKVTTQPRVYVLADGSTLPVFGVPAWCATCQAVVEAEVLPMPEAVESTGLSGTDLAKWRSWRNARKSKPRCFACGAPGASLPPGAGFLKFLSEQDAMHFEHPGCSGWFRVKNVGLAMGKKDPRRLSPEGLPL